MSQHAADFRVDILKARPQSVVSPTLGPPPVVEPIDVTDRILRDDFGSINRALERDFLSYKTGDLTCSGLNLDGFFDDLFAFMEATTIWSLRVFRRGIVQFWGVLIGKGSITCDRRSPICEITSYGLTKLLDMTSAETIKRNLGPFTVTTATQGQLTLTLNSTTGVLTGDVFHLTDHVNSEDVTVQRVSSGTVLQLETALAHGYAAGLPVELTTPFYRYKSIPWLAEQLAAEAGVGIAEIKISKSQFGRAAPTPVNLQGLTLAADFRRGCYQLFGKWGIAIHAVDSYSQDEPDDAWIVQGLPDRGIFDWSPYYKQGFWSGGPVVGTDEPFALYEPEFGAFQETSGAGTTRFATYYGAADYYSATKRIWGIGLPGAATTFAERTTTDGVNYTAATLTAIPGSGSVTIGTWGSDYDPQRNIVYQSWRETGGTARFYYRDFGGGGSWVDCKQADDDADTGYYGPRYIADKDYTLVLRQDGGHLGPSFEICAFRGAQRLWKRPFPGCLVQVEVTGNPVFYPTRTARYLNGMIYITLVSDGAVQLLSSSDDFQTYTMRKLVDGTTKTTIMACRVQDTYRIACYRGSVARGFFVAAPFYAGVIEYADFKGNSIAEGYKKLAVPANAVFSIDDHCQLHFVARDLYDPGAVVDVSDRLMEHSDTRIWDQTAQYVRVSGNGIDVVAGDAGFASEGIDIDSSFLPNEAFAQALADAYFDVYSRDRLQSEAVLIDLDGRIFQPLDRVDLGDGRRRLVYESDHSLVDDEIRIGPVEDR